MSLMSLKMLWLRRIRTSALTCAVVSIACGLIACTSTPSTTFDWRLPQTISPPIAPTDNPITEAKFQLGRHLFYDVRLSGNDTQACATCHVQAAAFTDGTRRSTGSTGLRHPRNAMPLTNAGYLRVLNWADPSITTLEQQVEGPLFNMHPIEMGARGNEERILARLRADSRYRDLFAHAFPGEQNAINWPNIQRTLATFVRGLVSFRSYYDRYVAGDANSLSPAAARGLSLFNSERLKCAQCHAGPHFTLAASTSTAYFNTGLYNIDGAGAYPPDNIGLMATTADSRDMGKFRVPSLRNVVLTAPYMHDGSVFILEEVIRFYERGGRLITQGENAGDGKLSPLKDARITGFMLSDDERRDLLTFLNSLTDEAFITDTRFGDPFAKQLQDYK